LAQADRIDPVVNQRFIVLSAALLGSETDVDAAKSRVTESQE
jgi:hypothetical protein